MKLFKSIQTTARKRSAGFSLTEATVGMGVVGIVFISLYSGLTSGMSMVGMARENARATQIMAEKLDSLRLYSWDRIVANTNSTFTTTFAPSGSVSNNSAAGVTFHGTVTVTPAPVDDTYKNNMRQITVSLSWETGTLKRHRSMTTLVAKDGMQNYIY
jgi:hypothetical protein